MEIERKFLIDKIPDNIKDYPSHRISQGYISTDPVVRIRQLDDDYILTIKSSGLLARTEIEKPLSLEEYQELSSLVKGNLIAKTRYILPCHDPDLTVELDIFEGALSGLIMAEVEYPDIEKARDFEIPDYFRLEVTDDSRYQNSSLSQMSPSELAVLVSTCKSI